MLNELRYALRVLLRAPVFTVTTVATLALAIGANVTVVSAVNTVLFRPLDIPDIGHLVVVSSDFPRLGLKGLGETVQEATELFARTDLFTAAGSSRGTTATLTGAGPARRISGAIILGAYFDVLGVRPALGRLPRAEDAEPGRPPVIVLSDGLWHEIAGTDTTIVGRTIELNGTALEVIGVLPPGYELPRLARYWKTRPLDTQALADPGNIETLIARPRPQLTKAQLAQALQTQAVQWGERDEASTPPEYRHTLVATPFLEELAGSLRPIVLLLLAAVTFVLLIACVNVAGVQLVRSIGSANALAIRSALGASRWRILRQGLVESVVLATGGGACGLLLGTMGVAALRATRVSNYPMLADVRLDTNVLVYALGLTVLVGLVIAFLPGLRTGRVAGRTTSLSRDRHGVLRGIAVVQVALTLVLLLGSGLMIRSLAAMLRVDPGFNAENVYTAVIAPTGPRYDSVVAHIAFFDGLIARLRGMPGVTAAGAASGIPFAQWDESSSGFEIIGRPPTGELHPHSLIVRVTPGYFHAMGIALVAGRFFTDADRLGAPRVAIVDEAIARKFLPGVDPIGQQITGQTGQATIVGVVASTGYSQLWKSPYPTSYYPYDQSLVSSMIVVVRTTTDLGDPAKFLQAAVASVDPNVPVSRVASMRQHIDASLESRRLMMLIMSAFAVASLALAVLGLYGVMSYSTSVRTQEFGIRLALGANSRALLSLVMGRGFALVVVGLLAGYALFLAVGRVLASFLYGVGAHDPLTFVICACVLATSALLACWLPARRAASTDPTVALRDSF